MLSKKLQNFFVHSDEIVSTLTEISTRNRRLSNCEQALISLELLLMEKLNVDCQSYLIGNFEIGISDEGEKIQLLVDINNYFWYENSPERDLELIRTIESIMERSRDWDGMQFSRHVPALNCTYYPTKQKFIITVSNGFKVKQSRLLYHFFNLQHEVLPFYHFIRKTLEYSGCFLKNFQTFLLVAFFLQQIDILPSIGALQQNVRVETIDGIEVQFDSTQKYNHFNLLKMAYYKDHAEEFFKFYRDFDFESNVISIFHGTLIERENYCYDLDANAMNMVLLKPQLNLTNHVTPQQVREFKKTCHLCFEYMRDNYNPEVKYY